VYLFDEHGLEDVLVPLKEQVVLRPDLDVKHLQVRVRQSYLSHPADSYRRPPLCDHTLNVPFHKFPFHKFPFHNFPFHKFPFHKFPFHNFPFHNLQPFSLSLVYLFFINLVTVYLDF